MYSIQGSSVLDFFEFMQIQSVEAHQEQELTSILNYSKKRWSDQSVANQTASVTQLISNYLELCVKVAAVKVVPFNQNAPFTSSLNS